MDFSEAVRAPDPRLQGIKVGDQVAQYETCQVHWGYTMVTVAKIGRELIHTSDGRKFKIKDGMENYRSTVSYTRIVRLRETGMPERAPGAAADGGPT
ncbi:hypothetical protein ACF07B_28180 [Streptomyces sp. NPDC015532]|jgi:hypothetical protein|uniref:hypothetical protein n=1 Tax=Streptomyces sp. NPDC015532 TaxID=3364960 RepID=UPI0036F5AE50